MDEGFWPVILWTRSFKPLTTASTWRSHCWLPMLISFLERTCFSDLFLASAIEALVEFLLVIFLILCFFKHLRRQMRFVFRTSVVVNSSWFLMMCKELIQCFRHVLSFQWFYFKYIYFLEKASTRICFQILPYIQIVCCLRLLRYIFEPSC